MKKILSAALLLCLFIACKDGEKWLRSYGYTPIRPASTLLQPGALLMKSRSKNTNTKIICSAEASLGAGFTPRQSNTISGKFKRIKTLGWHVNADVLSQIKADQNASDVADVFVTMDNARIVHIDDTDIYSNVDKRSRSCAMAIKNRKAAGWEISMIKSALVGDVTYKVSFSDEAKLDVQAKLAQVQQVSAGLGGNISHVTETTAAATGLVWGIKEDQFLAAISISDDEAKKLRRNSKLLPDDFVIENPVCATPPAESDQPILDDAEEPPPKPRPKMGRGRPAPDAP